MDVHRLMTQQLSIDKNIQFKDNNLSSSNKLLTGLA